MFYKTHLNISQSAFADEIGESQARVSKTERGAKPGSDFLASIANRYHELNIAWLLTGRGEALVRPLVFPDGAIVNEPGAQYVVKNDADLMKCRSEVEQLIADKNQLLWDNFELNKKIQELKAKIKS